MTTEAIAGAPADGVDLGNPFPGLRSFEPHEDHLFFGRERQIDELLSRLRRNRFVAVVGTSGSGKSSLVRSGLIPSLYSGFMVGTGSSWRVAIFRPGDQPVANLARALNDPEVLGGSADNAEIQQALTDAALRRSSLGLVECVRQARFPTDENLLVVVDQFEELFRFKRNVQIRDAREEALAFVQILLEASRRDDLPIYVVLTMRSDFIGNCTEFPGLVEATNEGQFLVPRMTRDERRSAIQGPVAVAGGEISPRLVTRLLNDVGDEPDQLPILQHALMRTWDYWRSHRTGDEPVDLPHYEAIGTLREALSRHAEEAYRELATDRQRAIAEILFKALTDRGSDSRGVRRPTRLGEICELAEASEAEVVEVVDVFRRPGRSFLMPPSGVPLEGDSILDISHESLMRIWSRLVRWVEEEARSAQVYLRLSRSAERYQEGKTGLLRDPELQLTLNWWQETQPNAGWARRYDPAFERAKLYLDYSQSERDRWIERREQERRRQLIRARWLTAVMSTASMLMLAIALYAFLQRAEAEQAREAALENEEIAKQQEQRAMLEAERARDNAEEARRAQQRAETQEAAAMEARHDAVQNADLASRRAREAQIAEQQALEARAVAEQQRQEAEQQRHRAESQRQEADQLRTEAEDSADRAQRLGRIQLARALAVQALRLRQDDQKELAALMALHARKLNDEHDGWTRDPNVYSALLQTRNRLVPALAEAETFRQHRDAVRSVALSPGGDTVVTGSDDGLVRTFDLARPRDPATLGSIGSEVRALAISPGGSRLAIGRFDGSLTLRPHGAGSGETLALSSHQGAVLGLAFQHRGSLLASAGADGTVILWDSATGTVREFLLSQASQRVHGVAFSPDDRYVAAATGSGLYLWDLSEQPIPYQRIAEGRDLLSVVFAADSRQVFLGSDTGEILRFRLRGLQVEPIDRLAGHESGVTGLARADGLLVSASRDGTVRLWPLDRDAVEPTELPDQASWIWTVAVTPDGERVLSGNAAGELRIFWIAPEVLVDQLCAHLERDLTDEEWSNTMPEDLPRQPACPPPAQGAPTGGLQR